MARRTLLTAVLALGVASIPAAAPAGESRLRVLVTGDSLVQPLDKLVGKRVKRAGGKGLRDPHPGTGISKPVLLDWVRLARRQAKKKRPSATVVFVGANEAGRLKSAAGPEVSCCRRAWIDAYSERVQRMIRYYQRKGRGQVYWLTLPTPRDDKQAQRFTAVNFALAQALASFDEDATLVDTVELLTPGNRFRRKMRYRGNKIVVRDRDGVHLTTAGTRVVRDAVLAAMRADGVL